MIDDPPQRSFLLACSICSSRETVLTSIHLWERVTLCVQMIKELRVHLSVANLGWTLDGLYFSGGQVIFVRWTGYIWQVDGLYFSGGQVIFVRWTGYNKWHRGRKVETTVQPATHRLWQFLTNFDKFWTIFWQLWQSRHFFFTILTIEKTVLESCDIWDTDYNSDNWEPELRQSLLPHN